MSALSVAILSPEAKAACFRPELPALRSGPAYMPPPRADQRAERVDVQILTEILEELDNGVIVCADDGKVLMANDAARRELQRGQPLHLDADGVLQVDAEAGGNATPWRTALRAAIHAQRRQLLPLGSGAERLMVSLMPLGPRHRPMGLVLLGRRQPAPDLAVEMLGRHYKLTSAERAVLRGLLAGQRVDDLAKARNVKLCTLRTQVASLRAKLGVARLDDVVRLVSELPPMTGALRSPALRSCGTMTPPPAAPVAQAWPRHAA